MKKLYVWFYQRVLGRRIYLSIARWSQLVGLRFEWRDNSAKPNPSPGCDWEVTEEAGVLFVLDGKEYDNPRRNKFWIVPVDGKAEKMLFCFDSIKTEQEHPWGDGFVDLKIPGVRFYRPQSAS